MTKEAYIAQAVAEAREKAEASWKTAVRREKYREVTERVDAWADAQSEAAGVSAWVMRSHIISLARTASGCTGISAWRASSSRRLRARRRRSCSCTRI